MVYDTEQKAIDVLLTNQEEFKERMCPVFQKPCLGGKCHSYNRGGVSKGTEKEFYITFPWCSSPLVTGGIEHNGDF